MTVFQSEIMSNNTCFAAGGDTAFVGCIFRAQFDNHWPIKRVFQEPRPDYVRVEPNFESVREERCGDEEILPEEEALEMR